MIEWWQAWCLALIQGLTEFLPISSSAHLLLPSLLLGWPDQGLAFDVAVHVGTLSAVLLYYRQTLWLLLEGSLSALNARRWNAPAREVLFLAIASLPVAVVGFLLNDLMDRLRTVPVLIVTTVLFALLLAWADRRGRSNHAPAVQTVGTAVFIGLCQALAPIPGTSRSGVTITAALFAGLSREAAARFSFLLSIPVIAGAGLLKSLDLLALGTPREGWAQLAVAALLSAVSAYACIALFLRLVERVGMLPFVIYRLLLGAGLLALWWR